MNTIRKPLFPFTALVGQEQMKQALILNVINPGLGGVVIRGDKGTAKSTAVRALAQLLPDIDVVKDCAFRCHPRQPETLCPSCRARLDNSGTLIADRQPARLVDLPLGATADRLIGSLDIEQAIKKGEKLFEPGILAQAHRALLYVDEVNLLDDHLVDVLLDVAAMGVNYVEREGVSYSHAAQFILVGTMNPEEGELRPQLLDRFGLCVEVHGESDCAARVEIMQRRLQFEAGPEEFIRQWQPREDELRRLISAARERLPRVSAAPRIMRLIAHICVEMGVQGHRADIAILKTARTLCAYQQREQVTDDDVRQAAALTLPHRMRRQPFQHPTADQEKLQQSIEWFPESPPADAQEPSPSVPPSASAPPLPPCPQTGDAQTTCAAAAPFAVKTIVPDAAPRMHSGSGRRGRALSDSAHGRYIRSAPVPSDTAADIAFDATLRAAAPYQTQRHSAGLAVAIAPRDLRQKVRQKKIGMTILFVVDASGSMGAQQRMAQTKAAVMSLLIDAYQKRDRIGLVAFKGNQASVLLAPTASVELAQAQLETLPTGGRTPLSGGLRTAHELLRREQAAQAEIRPLLVLLSDGKANSSMDPDRDPWAEALQAAREIRQDGIPAVVIDTDTGFVRLGKLPELAEALSGAYVPLADIRAEAIAGIVRAHSGGRRC